MATPASADPNRLRRSLAASATRAGDVGLGAQDVRERLKKIEQLQTAGRPGEAVAELMSIADAYAQRGAPIKAVAVLRQAAKIQPEAANIRLALGDVQQQLRMEEDAAREYATAFEIYERSQQFADMMQVVARLLAMDPDNLAGQLQLAEHLARAGHNEEAASLLRTLAATVLRKGSIDDWEKVAERAHAVAPADATLAHDLALHYVRAGRPAQALGKLLRCFEAVPNDAELLELIIEALEQLGQREKAAVICRQLIRTFERNGLHEEANRGLERLLALAPDDERARAYMGVLAPSVRGGTVIELQAGSAARATGDEPAADVAAGVAVARSRPGTMALPAEDLERLQAAIAREAAVKAAAAGERATAPQPTLTAHEMLRHAPDLPDDAPALPDDAPALPDDTPALPDDAPALHGEPAAADATVEAAIGDLAFLASVAAGAPPLPGDAKPRLAPTVPIDDAVDRAVEAGVPFAATAVQPPPKRPSQPHGHGQQAAMPPPTPHAHYGPAGRQAMASDDIQPTVPLAPPTPTKPPRTAELAPAASPSQSMRVTHQPALEALSELDDLEASEREWDDESGFDSAERTLVDTIDQATLERHGIRLADAPLPVLTMPTLPRAGNQPPVEQEHAFNPVAPAQPRSKILPRPRLSRQAGGAGEGGTTPRDISRDLGTLDFFIERGFHDSAVALLDALHQRHPGAVELESYRARVVQMRRG